MPLDVAPAFSYTQTNEEPATEEQQQRPKRKRRPMRKTGKRVARCPGTTHKRPNLLPAPHAAGNFSTYSPDATGSSKYSGGVEGALNFYG